jgi:hypothetical protein
MLAIPPAGMCAAFQELADACHGDHRPECPILRDLEGSAGIVAPAARKAGGGNGSVAGAVQARRRALEDSTANSGRAAR